ncbi:MAG: hypothetical protein P4L96_03905 [Rhodoferax sp.]|nr:hypothetical protein [Rhodoferax sp.]
MDDIIKIAIGVFIGALVALFAHQYIEALYARWELQQLSQQAQHAMLQSERRQAALQQQQAEQRARDRAALAQEQRADAQAREHELQLEDDKEQAWARFFQPSAQCRQDSGTMACANAYMAAKKRFDSQYRPPSP